VISWKENKPKKVILHCADTPDALKGDKYFDLFGRDDIDDWHRERGFNGIGYHFVVRRTGVVEVGRDIKVIGAHTYGENKDSIGVCYIGKAHPSLDQLESIINMYVLFKRQYGFDHTKWFGHYEFNPGKTCPGIDMVMLRLMFYFYSS